MHVEITRPTARRCRRGRCWRDCSTTPDGPQNASARNPSNFGSNAHPAPTGNRFTAAAAIGATGPVTGPVTGPPPARGG